MCLYVFTICLIVSILEISYRFSKILNLFREFKINFFLVKIDKKIYCYINNF